TLFIAFEGVALNLAFPKLDWINELQPAKQGISVLITMFGSMAVALCLAALYIFALGGALPPEMYMLLCAAAFTVVSAALYAYIRRAGARRFESLG
ncbi:MAG: hypothetical protein LBJ84_06560, partial [Oscillospiraceae bacterium]|nr:hypothetical protein [Oscillospiraceae bacterium]